MPYAGFSAGAAIAATHAVVGGWRVERLNRAEPEGGWAGVEVRRVGAGQ